MAALPARPQLSLSTLLARSATPPRPSARVATKPRPAFAAPAPRTLADLERASTIAPHSDSADPSSRHFRPPTPPTALILWVQVATCAHCGCIWRTQPGSVLIKYAENEHSFHQRRDDAALASLPRDLPREVKTKEVSIPFCEECFL